MLYRIVFPIAIVLCLVAQVAWSSDEGQVVESGPELPPAVLSGEVLEPQVTIRDTEQETVYEYRIEGKLVMVKVQPKGDVPPYYFIDNDGDGELEYTADDPTGGISVNQWVLMRW